MSSCVSSPTLTQYGEITTQVVTTSFSESVTTIDGGVTTIISTSCVPITTGNVTTSSCTTVDTVSTLPPTVITTNVAVPITTILTSSTPTATLYGSSCRGGGNPSPITSPTTTPTTSPTSITSFSSSSYLSISTMISTFRNGSVTTVTTTSVVPTSVIPVPSGGSSVNIGAIVGGVVGGIAGLAILIFLLRFFFFRKKPPYSGDDLDDLDTFYENKHLSKPSHNRGSAGIDEAYGGNNPPMSPDPASSNRVSSPGGYSYNNAGVGSSTGASGPQSDISSLNRGPSTGATTAMSGTSVYSPNPPQPMPGVGPGAQMSPGHFGPNGAPYGPVPVNPMFPMAAAVDPGMHRRGPSVGSGDANGNRQSYYSGPGSAPLSEGGSTLSSGGSFSANSRTPLTVANPTPTAAAAAATAYPRDVKDRTIYLNDAGYQVRGAQNGPESSQAAGSSGPVIQHSDGGAISPPPQPTPQQEIPAQVIQPQQDQSGPSSRRPFVHADSDFDERLAGSASPPPRNPKRAEAEQDRERHEEAPPPAYEE